MLLKHNKKQVAKQSSKKKLELLHSDLKIIKKREGG